MNRRGWGADPALANWRRRGSSAVVVLFAFVALTGCGDLPPLIGGGLEEGPPMKISSASIDSDGRAITLLFIGAKEFKAGDPCSSGYKGRAEILDEDTLSVEVVEANPPGHRDEAAPCEAMGFTRHVAIALDPAFLGSTVRNRGGGAFFVRRPKGLWEPTNLPSGWAQFAEQDLPGAEVARWQRFYAPDAGAATSWERRLDVIQAFGGPPDVTGGEDIEAMTVGGTNAILYKGRSSGELVLTWMSGGNGFALVASSRVFSAGDLVAIAESLEPPAAP